MKNLIIIIGTIILGTVIVNTLILGDGNSLKSTASGIMERGNAAIMSNLTFGSSGSSGTSGSVGASGSGNPAG